MTNDTPETPNIPETDDIEDTPEETPAEDTTTDTPEDEAHDEQSGKAGSEAARYRRRLRETEAERDALRTQLDAQRDALLEGVIAPKLVRAAGFDPAEALDDRGVFDPDKAADLARRTNAELGLGPRRPLPNRHAGQGRVGARSGPQGLAGAFDPQNLLR
ncbi:hypothetical protein [Mycobacteroides abscessus]|uniref:hypothetical protein n=2 Tax=Mycobacteroides abscessus TaxID=36809 RepID=UPI000929AFD8|nr:hypothetical protein [Mycobacteroides abscessus]MBN7543789.1 hypothetical protein [Mycobacteroides abscessus subsp. abscessus]QSM94672.1 hypothetical protein I3U31_02180 [Mycobacteroides abscessus subsp. abscessus]QSM99707.1 hypothetical protein I3U40_02180 [Mycobacteroides abscessus subsp. abscessus]SHU31238.1 Uncharacterised protein [Mycobacteroides abscessus subsp. abscessus]SHU52147.1 Uncharacterised protein [Mycobacteroides abscessus subsp. abscessus]